VTVWDDDERHAVAIAQEWLDYSEKLGIDPLATATVERVGDERHPEDIVGTSLPGSVIRPVPTLADGGTARTIEKTLGIVAIVAALAIVIAAVTGSVSAPWLLILSNLFVVGLLVCRWFVARNRWNRMERDVANE
jgi:Flp pilus assembly protein TadB